MLSQKEVAAVYETLLSAPGMDAPVKIPLQASRKTLLFLTRVIYQGIGTKDEKQDGGLLGIMDADTSEQLKTIGKTLLDKAGLTEMNERLNALQPK